MGVDPRRDPRLTRATRTVAAVSAKRGHGGWKVMVLPTAVSRSVRTYHVRRWHLRTFGAGIALIIGATLAGGVWYGTSMQSEELDIATAQLSDVETQMTAFGDTIRALRIAATLNPTPAAAGNVASASSSRRTRVAAEPVRPDPGVVLPVSGRISSLFSRSRRHPILRIRRPHLGVDLVAPAGSPIAAPAAGRIASVTRSFGYGLVVEVDHGAGVVTHYAHLRAALVREGQMVAAGTQIATVGSSGLSTGPHLHYEVRIAGRPTNPLRHVVVTSAAMGAAAASATPASATPTDSAGMPGRSGGEQGTQP
ncbi:MAG: M23 family metallopeptidase [Gemmatimonadaceae bacterium]